MYDIWVLSKAAFYFKLGDSYFLALLYLQYTFFIDSFNEVKHSPISDKLKI